MQLLLAQAGPLELGRDPVEERRREVGPVLVGGPSGDGRRRVGDEVGDQAGGPGRGGDAKSGVGADAEAQEEVFQGLGIAPGGELVDPGGRVLRSPQVVGLLGGEGGGDGTIRPGEPSLGGLVPGPEPRWRDRQDAAVPADHVVADVGGGGPDQGDPAMFAGLDLVTDPLGGGAGLAGAAAHEQEPGAPVAVGRPLAGPGPRVLAALAGGPAAGAGVGVPVPGGSVGDRRRDRGDVGLSPGDAPRLAAASGCAWAILLSTSARRFSMVA